MRNPGIDARGRRRAEEEREKKEKGWGYISKRSQNAQLAALHGVSAPRSLPGGRIPARDSFPQTKII